jgi:hypothetical protein
VFCSQQPSAGRRAACFAGAKTPAFGRRRRPAGHACEEALPACGVPGDKRPARGAAALSSGTFTRMGVRPCMAPASTRRRCSARWGLTWMENDAPPPSQSAKHCALPLPRPIKRLFEGPAKQTSHRVHARPCGRAALSEEACSTISPDVGVCKPRTNPSRPPLRCVCGAPAPGPSPRKLFGKGDRARGGARATAKRRASSIQLPVARGEPGEPRRRRCSTAVGVGGWWGRKGRCRGLNDQRCRREGGGAGPNAWWSARCWLGALCKARARVFRSQQPPVGRRSACCRPNAGILASVLRRLDGDGGPSGTHARRCCFPFADDARPAVRAS